MMYRQTSISGMLVIRHPVDGQKSEWNMFLKNNNM